MKPFDYEKCPLRNGNCGHGSVCHFGICICKNYKHIVHEGTGQYGMLFALYQKQSIPRSVMLTKLLTFGQHILVSDILAKEM